MTSKLAILASPYRIPPRISCRGAKKARLLRWRAIIIQGLNLSILLTLADVLSSTIKLWSIAQSALPRNIFNSTVRYLNTSLPTRKNIVTWGQSNDSSCSACAETETLLHVVAGCKAYLLETRYDWRLVTTVLLFLIKTFRKIKGVEIYSDLDDYRSPSIITGELLRPDLLRGCCMF